jgi:hypothetical protein
MTLVMIGGCFAFVYLTKQPGVVLLIFVLQGFIYKELVKIAVNDQQERALPGFHGLYWYWFLVATFFMYIKTTQPYLLSALRGVSVDDVNVQVSGQQPQQPQQADAGADAGVGGDGAAAAGGPVVYGGLFGPLLGALDFLVSRYEAVAYALYILGFMAFVIALKRRRNFRYQFSQFAYCHMALLFVVVQSTYLAANVFNGLIWFFVPCGLVVCNDSFAYVAGEWQGAAARASRARASSRSRPPPSHPLPHLPPLTPLATLSQASSSGARLSSASPPRRRWRASSAAPSPPSSSRCCRRVSTRRSTLRTRSTSWPAPSCRAWAGASTAATSTSRPAGSTPSTRSRSGASGGSSPSSSATPCR